jgi:hypothetical protein
MDQVLKFSGIDVGGKRKGFHLVGLLEDNGGDELTHGLELTA